MNIFSTLIGSIFLVLITVFPIYLWAYGVTRIAYDSLHRFRFFLGLLVGGVSVILLASLSYIQKIYQITPIWYGYVFIFFISGIVFFLIQRGSGFIRVLLERLTFLHVGIIAIFLTMMIGIGGVTQLPILSLIGMNILIAALLEESSKHLISLGSTGMRLRFTAEEMVFINFFCVLGFVFMENILYIARDVFLLDHFSFFHLGFRSFFTLIAHLFAGTVCTFFWWKALSYPFFSRQYIGLFSLGFLLATLLHALYNAFVEYNLFIAIICFSIVGYFTFVTLLSHSRIVQSR